MRTEGFLDRPGFKYPLAWIIDELEGSFYWATLSQFGAAIIASGGPLSSFDEAMSEVNTHERG